MEPADPARVLAEVTTGLAGRRDGTLDERAVESLDVLGHALTYCGVPNAREVWLGSLRSGVLDEVGSTCISQMVLGLNEALRSGDEHRVLQVCDCLAMVFGASVASSQ